MGSKIAPGPFDAYQHALPDEPMFVLLARDESAPKMLRHWADQRRSDLLGAVAEDVNRLDDKAWQARMKEDLKKATEADMVADEMASWRKQNEGVWRDVDQHRLPLQAPADGLPELIERATVDALVRLLMIGEAQLEVVEHRINPWSRPGFAIRRHYFRLKGKGPIFEPLKGQLHPDLVGFAVSGHNVLLGDVLAKVKKPDDMRLELQLVEMAA